jgi:hypothetical protein
MADTPMNKDALQAARAEALRIELEHTYGLVWPDGRVTMHVCISPRVQRPLDGMDPDTGRASGDVPLRWLGGELTIRAKYKGKVRFLKDMCIADGVPEKFDVWRQIVHMRRNGQKVRAFVKDVLPPSVLRMRGEHNAGLHADHGWDYDPVNGLRRVADIPESEKAERIASLLNVPPTIKPALDGAAVVEKAAADRKRVASAITKASQR